MPNTPGRLAILRQREVALYISARFCSSVASTLLRATIVWHVYEISGSKLQLGLIGAVQFVPTVVLSLLAGAAADSYDRRRIVMGAQLLAGGASIAADNS